MSEILRTPDDCFAGLPDYDFTPHYLELDGEDAGLRMHYLDEGSGERGELVLLHGQGSWCYIYRHMIGPLVAAGYRVLAPDFIGFGRSDKPADGERHSHAAHHRWLQAFLDACTSPGVHLYCFDWGSNFALPVITGDPGRYGKLIFSSAQPPLPNPPGKQWFLDWRARMFAQPKFPMGEMVAEGVAREMSAAEIAAYDAPFPDERYKAGPKRFPMIHPVVLEEPEARVYIEAWNAMGAWQGPALTLYNSNDGRNAQAFQQQIPGAAGQPHQLLPDCSFYLIEDHPQRLAQAVVDFLAD
ncbi:MAG: alpha/beta fold hydrolase [Gammaproteobacteria bacterium]|nr:MAG: alpha/beta fold hydrolase [Gammaproteobacteria bacterium]